MSAAPRSASLPYIILLYAVVLFIFGAVWGVIDSTLVSTIVDDSLWMSGSAAAQQMQGMMLDAWTWLPLVILIRMSLEVIIKSRGAAPMSNLALSTVILITVNMLMLVWALSFGSVIGPYLEFAVNYGQGSEYIAGIKLARDIGFAFAPGLLNFVIIIWYIVSPIKRDVIGGPV